MSKNLPLLIISVATGLTISSWSEVAKAYTGAGSDPDDPFYLVSPGEVINGVDLDGVGRLLLNKGSSQSLCTASKISSTHILTAAHCVTDNQGNLDTKSGTITWNTDNGNFSANLVNIFTHDLWTGNAFNGFDLAVIETTSISSFVPTYELYTGTDEIGKRVDTKVGFGRSGTGNTGDPIASGTKRQGQNVYDGTGSDFFTNVPSNLLVYDFDSGSRTNDTLGFLGAPDLGLGFNEVMAAPGDSGGATFIQGKIAGVTSFIGTIGLGDNLSGVNSSFGELGFDTRVSSFIPFINEKIGNVPVGTVPEPLTILGSAAAIGFGALFKRKLAKKSQKDSSHFS